MHHQFYEDLRLKTSLIQFYVPLTRGRFTKTELKTADELIYNNIDILKRMRDVVLWDGRYDLVKEGLERATDLVYKARGFLKLTQIGTDEQIAGYIKEHDDFYQTGIDFKSLSSLLDVSEYFIRGHMLQERFLGFQEQHFQTIFTPCLDYVHSAAYFYNEGYDYFHGKKEVKTYDQIPFEQIGLYEMRRIQPKEEVMFRNFREAYINIILFIESFINSVGYDAYLAGFAQTPNDELKLQGIQGQRKNGRYNFSSLKDKLIDITRIIGGQPMDPDQEPFYSYLQADVELRNLHMHSKFTDNRILLSHEGWKQQCDLMINNKCFQVLEAFWSCCYASKPFPLTIFNTFKGNSFKGHQGVQRIP